MVSEREEGVGRICSLVVGSCWVRLVLMLNSIGLLLVSM